MASIGEVKKRLPEVFTDNLYKMFSPGLADKILMGMSTDRSTTLRVNTLKYSIHDLMNYFKNINIKFDRVNWYKDALVIKNARERDIEKLDVYKQGFIYLQSLSSMVPPLILNPKENEIILDMTAAPGSKTSQMAALMNNKGVIIANELDKVRCERLKYNIDHLGASIVSVTNGRGEKLGDHYFEHFDKVLLDAPCSGEGRFLVNEVATYRSWSEREVERLKNLQKKLFDSAYKALKTGGILVYSTCTLNFQENENIIDWAVTNLGFEAIDIDISINGLMNGFTNEYNKSVGKAVRIMPSKEMEGFFICKLKKRR